MDHGIVLLEQLVAHDHLYPRLVRLAQRLRRRRQLGRPHVRRRRGDEIARHRDRLDRGRRARAVGVLWPDEARPLLCLLRLVAIELPCPEADRHRGIGHRHRRGIRGQPPGAGGKPRRERTEIPQGRLGRNHKDCTRRLAVASRQHHEIAGVARNPGRFDPAAARRTLLLQPPAPFRLGNKLHRERRRRAVDEGQRHVHAHLFVIHYF